jgi:Family of unknown function (DUF6325)
MSTTPQSQAETGRTHHEDLGPVDAVVIAWPPGAPMTGEAADALIDLVDRGVIRVLDTLFVMKDGVGHVSGFEAKDLDERGVGALRVFEGASSGLLGDEDATAAGEALDPGMAAAVILFENRWAAPFAAAVRRNGGVVVDFQRIHVQALIDAAEAAS